MAKKGEGKERRERWRQGDVWDPNNFIPAWTDEVFTVRDPVPFSVDLQGKSEQYLPLYINNDKVSDGTNVIVLSLDPENGDPPIGFSQEIYVLKEEWDNKPGNPEDPTDPTDPDSGRIKGTGFSLLLEEQNDQNEPFRLFVDGKPTDALTKAVRVDANKPNNTPKLVPNGAFTEAIVIIEDADGPPPLPLSSGKDNYQGSEAVDVIYAKAGNDSIWGDEGNDTVRGEEGNDSLWGEEGKDVLLGEAGNDILYGGDSDDVVDSVDPSAIDDYLNGGSGDDVLHGGTGLDILDGMMDDDLLLGGEGVDQLDGGSGNDTLDGGSAEGSESDNPRQFLDGGSGDDILMGGIDFDELSGGDGNDILIGGNEQDFLDGGNGDDILKAGRGNDTLNGYGTVKIDDPQFDTLIGGAGADNYILGGSWGISYVESGSGYTVIKNWNVQEDRIDVRGSAANESQFRLDKLRSIVGGSGIDTEIYYNGDRIAVVQDTTNISFANFSFV